MYQTKRDTLGMENALVILILNKGDPTDLKNYLYQNLH